MQLSRGEAQALIYRGWGRLALAMNAKHIPDHMAQEWEDGALQEAHAIVAVAKKGPVSSLTIPPLPLALIEVHRGLGCLGTQRPLRPSDIHSPFNQARSSPWAKWVSDTNDEQIPPQTELGDATTFWWMSPEEKRSCEFTHYGYLRGCVVLPPPPELGPPEQLFTWPTGAEKKAKQDPESTPKLHRKNNRPSKRQRDKESSSEYEESEAEGEYIYVPKCDYCKDRGLACIAQSDGPPARCLVCKEKKVRCSAIHGENKAVKKSTMKSPGPVKRSVVDMLLSQGTESVIRPPSSKRQRVFVDVPLPSTSKVEQSGVVEPLKFGPPGGKFKHQLRAERATAAAARRSADSRDTPSRQSVAVTPTFTSTPDTKNVSHRVMVEKGVSTENEQDRRDTRRKLKVSMSLIQEVIQKLEHNTYAYLD